MDIAALSVQVHQASLVEKAGTAVLKKAMDTAKENSDAMVRMMEKSVSPNLGTRIDIRV